MGSDSDLPLMAPAAQVLQDFGVSCSVRVVSAHRTPERMFEFARAAHLQGVKVRPCCDFQGASAMTSLVLHAGARSNVEQLPGHPGRVDLLVSSPCHIQRCPPQG